MTPPRTPTTMTFGPVNPVNDGCRPIVLLAARLIEPSHGLTIRGASAKRFSGVAVQTDESYPPTETRVRGLRPLRGFVLPTRVRWHDGAQLFLGVHIDKPGRYFARGVSVEYRLGARHYRARFRDTLAVCTREDCDPPDSYDGQP